MGGNYSNFNTWNTLCIEAPTYMYLDVGGCPADITVLSHINLTATPDYSKSLDQSKGEAKQQLEEGSSSSPRDLMPSPSFPVFQCGSPGFFFNCMCPHQGLLYPLHTLQLLQIL